MLVDNKMVVFHHDNAESHILALQYFYISKIMIKNEVKIFLFQH